MKNWLEAIVARQMVFSRTAFGPGPRTTGIRKHIAKELDEIRDDPEDVLEWIDVIILGMDGAWRCLAAKYPWLTEDEIGKMVAEGVKYKIGVNEGRSWPDWRDVGQDEPIEHDRGGDESDSNREPPPRPLHDRQLSFGPYCPKCRGWGRLP